MAIKKSSSTSSEDSEDTQSQILDEQAKELAKLFYDLWKSQPK